jgi:two-component system chemotaxis response regulator CheY
MTKTALIVDDSASMRQMVAFTLKEAGYAVIEGANGKEALVSLDAAAVNVIITDLNMPVMDGMTFIKQVRTRAAHRFTPILLLTTESGDARKQEGKAAGATGWIVKPFNPAQLLQIVKKVLP